MKPIYVFILAVAFFFFCDKSFAECKKHVELHSAKHIAKEMGQSEARVLQAYRINIWAKKSDEGKFPKIGQMLPGSRALILDEAPQDYKIKSPLDNSEGWISKIQVKRVLWQDTDTRKPCKNL